MTLMNLGATQKALLDVAAYCFTPLTLRPIHAAVHIDAHGSFGVPAMFGMDPMIHINHLFIKQSWRVCIRLDTPAK
jgi:hypothetical protein